MSKTRTSPAVVFSQPNRADFTEVVLPPLEEGDLFIRIEYSAVSIGTERWVLTGRMEIPGEAALAFPHVPGYQAAGTVLEAGPAAASIAPGDRVFSRACRAPAGWNGSWWGGHVGCHVASAGRDIVKLPSGVSTLEASCLLLAQVGYNGASKPAVAKGDVAVVIGDGLVGQFASQVLRHRGAHTIMSGLSPERLELAGKYSADEVYDNRRFDFAEYATGRYPGGVDIVLDTASTMKTVREGAALLKRHGHLVLNGYYPPGDSLIDWHWLRRKELTLYCADSRSHARLAATVNLIRDGKIKVKELVTHTFSPRRASDAYAMLLEEREDFLGIVFEW